MLALRTLIAPSYVVTCLTFAAHVLIADACREGAAAIQRRDLTGAEGLLQNCNTLEGHLMLAGIYQERHDATAVYKISVEGLKRFPSEKRFYLAVASRDARDKRYADAVKVLEEALRRWPDDEKIRSLLASSHFALGTEFLDSRKDESAIHHLLRATQLSPRDFEAHLNLGRALHNLLRYEEARKVFDTIVEQDTSFPLVHFHRGMAFYALGDFERAASDLSKEIERNPDYPPARLVRGLSLLAKAEWESALKDLDVAATRMPSNATAHYGRARALVRLGQLDAAEAVLRKVLQLDPADPAPVNTLVSVLMRLHKQEEARVFASKAAMLARERRTAAPGEIVFDSRERH